jgi:hypothetical protein
LQLWHEAALGLGIGDGDQHVDDRASLGTEVDPM